MPSNLGSAKSLVDRVLSAMVARGGSATSHQLVADVSPQLDPEIAVRSGLHVRGRRQSNRPVALSELLASGARRLVLNCLYDLVRRGVVTRTKIDIRNSHWKLIKPKGDTHAIDRQIV